MSLFQPVTPKLNVQSLEAEQADFWKAKDVIARSYSERAGQPSYVFYEGPPTANGRPGSHHVLARAFKDMFPRYKVMRGYQVLRKGGWDTHGLPVEIEVEKELGIKHKSEIEQYGIAEFNKKCRESVFRYTQEWEKLTERIGYWVDLKDAYVTYHNDYIESEWWLLRQMWDKGLLYRGYKVVPYCARCGTPLSTHELAQGYADVSDPSVYVRFPLIDEPGTSLLAWTTTPWTLPGNVALAVNQAATYAIVEGETGDGKTEKLILAEALIEHALQHPENYRVVGHLTGADLINKRYQPPYDYMQTDKRRSYVVHGDFVGLEDGTGIVHIAPAFGADDLEIGQLYDLPVLRTVGADGMFLPEVTLVAGLWFKDADLPIIKDLKARGVLFRQQKHEHSYPFCWRCKSPLMYYARNTWFIATTRYRDQLVALNNTIHWEPEHIQQGRFGNWLAENRDWALGRERYWGTPLPIWSCDNPDCGHMHCVSSVAELSELSGHDQTSLDLHRPYVDDVTWRCATCNTGTMKRAVEVIDVWFDSGAMPVAQWGYPAHNKEMFGTQFPADYICEAVDQTRGWFYSLHAIATLAFGSVAFKNVICLGHILDENGEKMSKSKGNIVQPWPVLEKYGADAFRWYLYTASAPGEPRRFSVELVGDVIRNFTLTLWNTYSFYVTYANIDNFDPTKVNVPIGERDELDRWVLSELYRLVQRVTEAYEAYDVTNATRPIQVFIDDLSNWYLRRSRRRFWKSDSDTDKAAAHLTLYECLLTVSKLLAPAMPFLADAMYRNLAALDPHAPESVHLAHWPTIDEALIDQQLVDGMALIKKLAELGRSAREGVNIKLRQPLAEGAFAVRNPAEAAAFAKLDYLLMDELNLKHVHLLESAGGVVAYSVHPMPSKLGKRLGPDWPRLQKVVREADAEQAAIWARQLRDGKPISLNYEGVDGVFKSAELAPAEVEIRQSASSGYAIAEEGGYLVALTTELNDALIAEGLAREVVRRVQVMRRDADFALDDRIALTYQASERLAKALGDYTEYLRSETLTDQITIGAPSDGQPFTFEDGDTITMSVQRLANGHT